MPPGCVLEHLLSGPQKLNDGDVLTFARRVPEGAEESLGNIVASTLSLVADLRLAGLSLPVCGPNRDLEPNSTLVKVWEMRMLWEVDLAKFERLLSQFGQLVTAYCDEGRAQAAAKEGESVVAQEVEMEKGKGCKGAGPAPPGKSGGKGPGFPPVGKSGGKGPHSPPVGKSGGKGPGSPPPSKSGGKGPGPPPSGRAGFNSTGLNASVGSVEHSRASFLQIDHAAQLHA